VLVHLAYPYSVLVLVVVALLFWRPVWGIALLAAIFPMDPWALRLPVPGMNTETILVGVALAVTVLRFGARLPPLRYSGPVIAFLAVMAISFVVSIPWANGLRAVDGSPAVWFIFKHLKSMTFTTLLFFPAYWWLREPEDRQRVLVALCFALFLSSVVGIADYVFHINPRVVAGRERANGLIANANGLAESIGPLMFVPLYLLMRRRNLNRGMRIFAAASYGLAAVAMVLSLSRGNWLAFFAAHGVFLLLVNRRLLAVSVVATAILVSVGTPLLPEIVRDRIEHTTTTGSTVYQVPLAVNLEGSTASRVVFARIGLDMYLASPVWGNGLDSFAFRSAEFGAKYGVLVPNEAHNLIVTMAAEAGVIGLAMLAWLTFGIFRCGRVLWRSDSTEYLLGAVLLAAATHDFVANLSGTSLLHISQVSAQFWIVYALVARACAERFAEQDAPEAAPLQAGRWRRFADRARIAVPQTSSARVYAQPEPGARP
jgi:hypothetical protein